MKKVSLHLSDFIRRTITTMPSIHYYAFGIFLAWSYLAFTSNVWSDARIETDGSAITNVFVSSTIGFLVICFLAVIKKERFGELLASRWFLPVLGILGSACCGVLYFCGPDYLLKVSRTASTVVSLLAAFGTGLSTGAIAAQCLTFFSSLPPKRAWFRVAGNQALAVAVYFLIMGNPFIIKMSLFCILPLIASLMLASTVLRAPRPKARPNYERLRPPGNLLTRFFAMVLILNMTESFIRFSVSYSVDPLSLTYSTTVAMSIRLFISIVAIICIATLKSVNVFTPLYYACVMLVVAVPLLVSLFAANTTMALCLFISAYTIFEMLIWCLLAHIAYKTTMSSLELFGKGWGSLTLGGAIGCVIGILVANANLSQTSILMLSVSFALLCLASAFFVFSGSHFDKLIQSVITVDDVKFTEYRARMIRIESDGASFIQSFESFCVSFAFSPREQDIAKCLIENKQINDIAKECSLSINTVRRHIQNIYGKMDVHSREEFNAAFQKECGLDKWV